MDTHQGAVTKTFAKTRAATSAGVVTTPVCSTAKVKSPPVSGPAWSPCAELDTDCSVGVLDPVSKCCHAEPRPDGVTCSSRRAGACDGFGTCKASKSRDRDGDGIKDTTDDLIGAASWIRTAAGTPELLFVGDTLTLRIDDRTVASVPANARLDLSTIQLARTHIKSKFQARRILSKTPWTALHFDRSATSVCVATTGYEGELSTDCSAAGLLKLDCPSAEGAVTCTQVDNQLVVQGKGVEYAWIPLDGVTEDIRLLHGHWIIPVFECTRCQLLPPGPGYPVPELAIERCDGVDNDRDGRIDENGAALCNDHLNCTFDSCVRGVCQHTVRQSVCNSGAECMEMQCGVPFESSDGQDAGEFPNRNGCYEVFKHDVCNAWDGCLCNGAERCDPSAADSRNWSENKGCVAATPPLELPCEANGGDGNGCTVELCCEPWNPDECRYQGKIRDAGLAQTYQSACGTAGDLGLTRNVSVPGGSVQCLDNPFKYNEELDALRCDDNNPCTDDSCESPSGACHNDWKPDGPQPGCEGTVERGCGERSCSFGACVTGVRTPDAGDPYQCAGTVALRDGSLLAPTCASYACNGARCEMQPNQPACSDGTFCNGEEQCSIDAIRNATDYWGTPLPISPESLPSIGHYYGCVAAPQGPCVDGIGCTSDICDEATNSCSNPRSDQACHTLRGMQYNACSPQLTCDPSTSGSADGCVDWPENQAPCSDGVACSIDSCSCANEFCTVAQCSYNFSGCLPDPWPDPWPGPVGPLWP